MQIAIGKTTIEVGRATGFTDLHRSVMYRKLFRYITELAESDEDIKSLVKDLTDAAWNFAQLASNIKMDGTISGWSKPSHLDSAANLYRSFAQFMSIPNAVTNPVVAAVNEANAPITDPALVPPELLTEAERTDPLSEPPEGGSKKPSTASAEV